MLTDGHEIPAIPEAPQAEIAATTEDKGCQSQQGFQEYLLQQGQNVNA